MEPNKIEKQFREKLSSREIQPSAQAWDRLDAMLSVAEEKKTKRSPFLSFQFIGIAACILVLLTVGMFLFTQKNTNIEPQNNVVGTETKKDTVQNPTKNNQTPIIENKIQTEAVASSENQQSPNNNQRVSVNNQKTKNNQNQIINEKVIQNQKQEVIAQNQTPKLDDRIDINIKSDAVLIADLDKTSKQTSNQKSNVKVDAKSLLSQVDGEVEYTFREKMLNKMNKNYKEIKVALANRNNE